MQGAFGQAKWWVDCRWWTNQWHKFSWSEINHIALYELTKKNNSFITSSSITTCVLHYNHYSILHFKRDITIIGGSTLKIMGLGPNSIPQVQLVRWGLFKPYKHCLGHITRSYRNKMSPHTQHNEDAWDYNEGFPKRPPLRQARGDHN